MALALQSAALVALAAALFGGLWPGEGSAPRWLVLVDRSQSMPRAVTDQARAELVLAARAAGAGALQQIEFAGRPISASAPAKPSPCSSPKLNDAANSPIAASATSSTGMTSTPRTRKKLSRRQRSSGPTAITSSIGTANSAPIGLK